MDTCQFTRGRVIGRGSTATVSIATAHPSGEVFAVKSAELAQSQPLQREERILSQLSHPRIVSFAGSGVATENGREFFNLFMEYVAGGTLSDAIRKEGGRLEETGIRSLTREILEGVAYLHSRGLVHCDIKGRNVLIGEDGAIIADLGCARKAGAAGGGALAGTPLFMAPEVARGEEQGFAADVWAVGCTVVEMATGSPPWPETTDPVSALFRIGYSADLPEFPSWLSDQGKDFLGKCLRRSPDERLTVGELLKHPFVDESSSLHKAVTGSVLRNSPKSTLDLDFWDSLGEAGSDRELTQIEQPANSPAERVRRLAGVNSIPNWTWEENWVTVRGNEEYDIIPADDEMDGPDSSSADSDDHGLDCSTSLGVDGADYSSDLVNDSSFDEGNSTSFVINEEVYSNDSFNCTSYNDGNFSTSGKSFLCFWRGFAIGCKCNRAVVYCNLNFRTLNSIICFRDCHCSYH